MIRNYLKVAIRNITKHKFFSIINILGLTIGIAACLFVSMYIYDELTYDHFHAKGERIYRVNLHGKLGGQDILTTNTSYPMAKAMVEEIPEVEEAVRVNDIGDLIFRNGDIKFSEDQIAAVDSNYFSVFSFELMEGNAETALVKPNSIVINQYLAKKYFNNESALGKVLTIGIDKTEYSVTGIMEGIRGNSHLKFNALISATSLPRMRDGGWLSNSLWTYYVTSPKSNGKIVDEKLAPITDRNVTPIMLQFMGKSLEQFRVDGGIYEYISIPLYDIHLKSQFSDEAEAGGDISYVYILGGIGLFIVLLACINFMNLTTAKSASRAKEVGLRKTLGSQRKTLIIQFLTESMIYSISAGLFALLLVFILLPSFNMLSGKILTMSIIADPIILITFILLVLFVGLVAGSYPAFYLTGFKITDVLKGKLRSGMKSGFIRSFLVTFQFWISIVLIICTAIVYQQLNYVQNKNLGIDKDHILMIEGANRLDKNKIAFKNALDANSVIKGTSYSNNEVPGVNNTTIFRAAGSDQDYIMANYFGDYDHLKTLGFEMAEGRFFSRDFPSDSSVAVLNQAAVKEFGWENPLEEKIVNFNGDTPVEMPVIGVIKDFNFESLKTHVRPLILLLTKEGNVLYTRFSGENPENVVAAISDAWKDVAPDEPLQYSFLDESYDKLFRAEQRLGKVFTTFTAIAIFIACLGLFGLAAFMAEQRTKEIGIRKVMGASLWSVTSLMSKDFAKLVIIAFVLAIYPAYYAMDIWLNDFANRIDIGLWVFVISGVMSFGIAWFTVSYQSLKAARVNPVKSLKYE